MNSGYILGVCVFSSNACICMYNSAGSIWPPYTEKLMRYECNDWMAEGKDEL